MTFKNPKNNKIFPDKVIEWNILLDIDIKSTLNDYLSAEIKNIRFGHQNKLSYSQFFEGLMKASSKGASCAKEKSKGWYYFSKGIIQPLVDKRSEVLHSIRHNVYSNEGAISLEKEVRRNLREGIDSVKNRWSRHLADITHQIPQNLKHFWQAITTLKEGILGLHKSSDIMRFANEDGTFTTSDEEVEILSKFFHDVYNRNVSIDWSVLEEIKKKPTLKQLNDPLTRMEFNQAIKKKILHKAPGLNGVTPNAIKALDDENINVLIQI